MSARNIPLPARLLSFGFLRAYVVTMRPYLLFVSGITGVAGLSLAPALSPGATGVLAAVFFLSYGFGQALTDCFQMDTDTLSSPYRPLVAGQVKRRHVLLVSLSGLALIGVILALFDLRNLGLAALATVGLATYTWFKRRWWGGPFYNAWIVAVLALIGYVSGAGAAGSPLRWSATLGWVLVAVFFGYANFVLAGYFKDVSADRATGYRTLPVVCGLQASSLISDLFAVLSVFGAAVAVLPFLDGGGIGAGHVAVRLFLVGGGTWAMIGQVRLHAVRRDSEAHSAIAPVVHAYILLLSAVAAAFKPAWVGALVLFYIAFLFTLRFRPMRQQI